MVPRVSPIELAVMAVRAAMREGATEAEAFVTRRRGYSVSILAGRIKGLESMDEAGVGIRVAVGKRVGFAYATGLDTEAARRAARAAVKQARASPEDPYWPGLPEPPERYPEPSGVYGDGVARASPESIVEDAKVLIGHVAAREGVQLSRASIGVSVFEEAIANSNGVYAVEMGTYASVMVSIVVQKNGLTTPAVFEFESSRVAVPDVTAVANRAVEKALLATKVVKGLQPGRYTVVYQPQVLAELLDYTVLSSLNGENVVRGRSYYVGKTGGKVMDERITIIDDGLLKGGDSTGRFDGEGVPMQTTVLVEKGVLRGFIYDNYWASRVGTRSTGNAVRSGYSSRPRPGFTNIVIPGGDAGPEELYEGRVLVIYQVQGAHTANPETGEYSVLANPAILYENGEPKGWVPGLVLAGNLYKELAENVEAISKWTEKPYPGAVLPAMRLRGVSAAPRG